MKMKFKTLGIYISMKLMNVSQFLFGLTSTSKVGWFFYNRFALVEALAHWLFGISYYGSTEEVEDALHLGFGEDWKCYNKWQLQIIDAFGLREDSL